MRGSRIPLRKAGKIKQTISKKKISNKYLSKVIETKNNTPNWDNFFSNISSIPGDWDALEKRLQPLRQKYAWAVPDQRALNILKEFSPLIEIGAGNGYWARLLLDMGVNIIAYDVKHNLNSWTDVKLGGPEVLLDESIVVNRTLFLCYPDEDESIAIRCLENYNGEYIIHVGEIMTSGTLGGVPQAPFGRTSSAEFQITLTCSFHCILIANLQCSPPYGKDTISVWKRTQYVPVTKHAVVASTKETTSTHRKVIKKKILKKKKKNGDIINLDTNLPSESPSMSTAFGGFVDLAALRNVNKPIETNLSTEVSSLVVKEKKKISKKVSPSLLQPLIAPLTTTSRLRNRNRNRSEDDDREIRRLREKELDVQYEESDSKLWANIPTEERLPVDRAAPCLQHLLAGHEIT